MNRPAKLCVALAAAGLLTHLNVWAQEAAAPSPEASSEVAPTVEKGQLEEVVVTAQKRRQSASKTPLALSVISGAELKSAGVNSAVNLTEQLPNTEIGKGWAGGVEVTLRGIGSTDGSERGDPAAAFHIDGIYIGRTRGAGAAFFDVDRIEVLRGPQGTLYGRNANAGVINVISKKPSNVFEGSAGLELGNYNLLRTDAMLNVPVNETLSLRAVVQREKHDGYSDTANSLNNFGHDRDDLDNTSARLHALFKFTPDTTWLLTGDAAAIKGHGQAAFNITNGSLVSDRTMNPQVEGKVNNHAAGLASEFKTGLGFADLTYLYGHRRDIQNEIGSNGEAPGLWFTSTNWFKQDSHEVRLSAPAGAPVQWIGGFYSYRGTTHMVNFPVYFPNNAQLFRVLQDPAWTTSNAVFGQATYPVLPVWRVTAGLRYTKDAKGREGLNFDGNDVVSPGVNNHANRSWNKMTYKLGTDYDLTKTTLLFANLATGFKAGGFNDGNDVVGDPNYNPSLYYKPESILSVELGHKSRFFGNKLQVNSTAFNYDYKDMQLQSVINNRLVTGNAGRARVKGLEVEGKAVVSDAGRVNFALGLLDSTYSTYVTPNGSNYAGKRLDKSPELTLNLGYTHTWSLESGASVSANAGTRYSASYLVIDPGSANTAPKQIEQKAYTKSNASVTYNDASDRWSLQGYVNNIEDKRPVMAVFTAGGANSAFLAEPRTIGLRANLKF